MESTDPSSANREEITETFTRSFFRYKPALARLHGDGFSLIFNLTGQGELELSRIKGRPRRLVDRRV
ncbi:MAG: hypothetical protein HGA40_05230 [Methanoregulaceae archaeon]|nr:hypothetical protein [Methanoregulaceae archaeon]